MNEDTCTLFHATQVLVCPYILKHRGNGTHQTFDGQDNKGLKSVCNLTILSFRQFFNTVTDVISELAHKRFKMQV